MSSLANSKESSGLGVWVSVCVFMSEAIAKLGNIIAVPESKEKSKTDFFIVSPHDKIKTEAHNIDK